MGFVKTGDLEPGMIVSEDVMNMQGKVLVRKGTSLNMPTINRLSSIGIFGADIVDDDRDEEEVYFKQLSRIKRIEKKFSSYRHNRYMLEILAAVKEHFKEK